MLVPIMDPGLSLLRSPRLTALSCQTNEHARKQRKRKEREKKRGGGYERGGMRERDLKIGERILIRKSSERGR